jgi:hypothetical protein
VATANEYREMVDKCLRSAREAETDAERMTYLALAQTWLCEVLRRDSTSPVPLPPAPHLRLNFPRPRSPIPD